MERATAEAMGMRGFARAALRVCLLGLIANPCFAETCTPGAPAAPVSCAAEIPHAESAWRTATCNTSGNGYDLGPCMLQACLPPYVRQQDQCSLQSCFQAKNATEIHRQKKRLLTEASSPGCGLTRPGTCRSSGFFSMANVNDLLFAGTYNNGHGYPQGRSNYLQTKSLIDPRMVVDWSSGTEPTVKESFYRIQEMGAGVIAVTETPMLSGAVFAWLPVYPRGGIWRKIYEWVDSPKNILRGIGVLDGHAYLSGYNKFSHLSSIRVLNRAAFETAAKNATVYAGKFRDIPDTGFNTIGFVTYRNQLFAYGEGGLRMLLPDGSDFTAVCDTRNARSNFKNAIVWKERLWIAGSADERPALFTYVPGKGCRKVFAPTSAQVGANRKNVKLWALTSLGNELFASTLCFDDFEVGACNVPLNALTQSRSGIFRCYDDPTSTDNGCLQQENWKLFMSFPEYGIKEMLILGEHLLVATNTAKDNRGGSVWKLSCPAP